ncbi:hypothetical protein GCM10027020_22880 [Nocardioides salsibiostraticola]
MKLRSILVALVFAAVTLHPIAASAQTDRLGLSSDGVTFAETLKKPLFDTTIRWVPGDVRVATFYVRNQADTAGNLQVAIKRVVLDDLIETNWLKVSARAGSKPFTSVTTGGRASLVENVVINHGDVLPVRVRVELLPDAPNFTQVLSSELDLLVRLSDARAIAPITPGTNVSPGQSGELGSTDSAGPSGLLGILPDTGNPLTWWTIPLALFLIITGAFLALRRRTEPEEEQP